jgi:hypothetical protein
MNRWTSSVKFPQQLALQSLLLLLALIIGSAAAAEIHIQETPDGGVQPRLSVDENGNVHLLYFKKRLSAPSAREGNLYYRQYSLTQKHFGLPIKVSTAAFNIMTFSIARASLAVGGDGRIHAVWYLPRENQYFYSRSDAERTTFEQQRPLVTEYSEGLDAGADIAAIGSQVAIVWGAGNLSREDERTVYGRISGDSGASFSAEMRLGNTELGACACCSLATDFGDENQLSIAYRSAIDGSGRHMQQLSLQVVEGGLRGGRYRELSSLQEWELSACPLSTNDIAVDAAANQWLVFETEARIVQLKLESDEAATAVAEPLTRTRQKNPAIAVNASGERLIVWGEAISHAKGGSLNMQLFAANGLVITTGWEQEITIPDFSFPAAAELPNGDFLVLY